MGAIIMVHGDDSGLVLPPRIAPTQLMIVPVQQHREGVLETASSLLDRLSGVCRAKMDASDRMPGWKFAEHEMRGIPLRLEIGPKDIEKNQCVLVRRDNGKSISSRWTRLRPRFRRFWRRCSGPCMKRPSPFAPPGFTKPGALKS